MHYTYKIFLTIIFLASFCINADRSIQYCEPLFKMEDNVASDAHLTVFAHDLTYDSHNGDVTNDHVFYRENDQEPIRIEFYQQDTYVFERDYDTGSSSWDNCNTCDATSYMDVEANRREMQQEYAYDQYYDDSMPAHTLVINAKKYAQANLTHNWPDDLTFKEEFKLWDKERDLWKASRQNADERYKARLKAFEKTQHNPHALMLKEYKVSSEAYNLIKTHDVKPELFKQGLYNPFQDQLHQELIAVIENIASIVNARTYPQELKHPKETVSFAASGVQHNKIGDVITTARIADFCWASLECAYAIVQGAKSGLIDVGMYAWQNPHELILYGLAPEAMSGYYTLKLMYSVGCLAKDVIDKGYKKYSNELTKDVTLPVLVHGVTAFIVQWFLNRGLNARVKLHVGKYKESFLKAVEAKYPELCMATNNVAKASTERFSQNKQIVKPQKNKPNNQQPGRQLTVEEKANHDTFLQKLAQKIYPGKKDAKICFKDILPSDPSKLEELGWKDVTDIRSKSLFSKEYFHEGYNLKIRYDRAQYDLNGFKGVDHYQILNHISHKFRYLDIHGNILEGAPSQAHIVVKNLLNHTCNGK